MRYVLEGSVRKAGRRVRITGQLIDAATGAHLWADRFDGVGRRRFRPSGQGGVERRRRHRARVQAAEIRRSTECPTKDLNAYDLYLRALPDAESRDKERIVKALGFLHQAIERDPGYGPALALAARSQNNLYVSGWIKDPEASRRESVDLARRALRAAGDDANTLARSAYALGMSGEDIEAIIAVVDRSLQLNPGYARGWHYSGWLRLWAGDPGLAIEHFETALRLNPRDPIPSTLMGIGVGDFFAERFAEASTMLLRSLQEQPGRVPTYRFLAACYAHMGRLDEARGIIKQIRASRR